MKFWSISTTIRNPERIRSFLQVLQLIEGELWTYETQKKFQILLIQHKVYGFGEAQFHKDLTEEQNSWLYGKVTYQQAEEILNAKKYVGGGEMRGRQSFNPLEKMGLAYIDKDKKIVISSFGKYFLKEDYDLGEVFFRSFLKWQYPNPDAKQYKPSSYDIRPFIATLHLILKVNAVCKEIGIKEKGVSKIEFALFFVSLSNHKDIDEIVKRLISFRQEYETEKDKNKKDKIIEEYFKTYYSDYESWDNAVEYTDNIIRYFRLTRYIYIRGNGWYIDIEHRRSVEIKILLETYDASAIKFENKEDYINYICDAQSVILPWENHQSLQQVLKELSIEISEKLDTMNRKILVPKIPEIDLKTRDINVLKLQIEKLRIFRRKLYELEDHYKAQLIENIDTYIENLTTIFNKKNRPIELEQNITLGLNALNDAISIKPNYPVGDDNEPTFTAPANKPDIECFYESFNSICEVTMLTNRSQWYNEGQPVMRHIRDFENNNLKKETYCLFIAPKLHRDTINTFWISVKYEYEGKKQKIVPLSITQFIDLLNILKEIKQKKQVLSHKDLKRLYDSIINETNKVNNSDEWTKTIPNIINNWKQTILDRWK